MTHGEHGATHAYTTHHPRWFRKRVSTYWWFEQWAYSKFVLRELSSIFVAGFIVIVLLWIRAVSRGPDAYEAFLNCMKNPLVLILSLIGIIFVVLHSVTWFGLTPRAMAVRVAGKRLPEFLIIAVNYVAWIVASGFIAWILLRG
jgi:fumarate reductase subunit C